jgi:hypothetical protein
MAEFSYICNAPFRIGFRDRAYVVNTSDPASALAESVLDNIDTDLDITIGGVTMFLAAWRDPDHWESDWAGKLNIPGAEVAERVAQIFRDAIDTDG